MNNWRIKSEITSLLLVFVSISSKAQDQEVIEQIDNYSLNLERIVDSLKGLSFTNKYDEIRNIRDIISFYCDLNNDSALVYSNKELEIAKQMEDYNELASARINSSSILNQLGKFELAKSKLYYNLKEKDRINDTIIASTQSVLSNILINTEEYDESISAALAAAETFELLNDSTNAGFSYISVAEVYSLALNNHADGIIYIKKAIVFLNAKTASKEYLIAALMTYGDLCVIQNDYESALNIYLEAKQIAVNNNEYWYFPDIMSRLGEVYYFRKEHEKSIFYLEKAANRIESNGSSEAARYEYLGLNYRDLNQSKKAISYFNLCLEYEENPRQLNVYREYLVECHLQISDYKTAFNIQTEITAYKDAINGSKQKEKVTEIIEKYDNRKKQQEIKTLNIETELQENRINQQQLTLYNIIGFFLLLISFGLFWFRTRTKLRETNKNLETAQLQQRFLRTQLNPHFFFHALTSIESYIYSNNKNQAASYLRNFSKLMRDTLEFSDVNFISLQKDINFIKKYIELQKLSHDFKFESKINISEELNTADIYVPPMLIQPAVENAILHGALSVENGIISIDYVHNNGQLEIRISDNGKTKTQTSFSASKLNRSMSTDITVNRINNIGQVHGTEISYKTFDSVENKDGLAVTFSFPIHFKPKS
ncbi:MAG: tetratricopeptide (TPR) repeat protein [Crocinitomix sp.]|jgi:tetratricopeptide (TPR) repeat protein